MTEWAIPSKEMSFRSIAVIGGSRYDARVK